MVAAGMVSTRGEEQKGYGGLEAKFRRAGEWLWVFVDTFWFHVYRFSWSNSAVELIFCRKFLRVHLFFFFSTEPTERMSILLSTGNTGCYRPPRIDFAGW
jgi:hypothetical protein